MSHWRQEWISEKIALAELLSKGGCKGSYPEAILILSAALNAIAAEMWPGKGMDKKRFVQLLIDHTPVSPSPATISVPMLIEFLKENSAGAEAKEVKEKCLDVCDSLVLGHELDKAESDLVLLCPSLSLKQLRKNSYASLFYEEVRSSYVHEYRAGKSSASLPMTESRDAKISYVNILGKARRIHFHVEWLSEIALRAAKHADSCHTITLAQPLAWWIEG